MAFVNGNEIAEVSYRTQSAVLRSRICFVLFLSGGLAVPCSAALTGSLSPSATVGVTNTSIVGTASPNATVTETTETWPDGTTHGPYSTTANSSGNYTLGPFILQQLGTYHGTLKDSVANSTINITYSGNGGFSAAVNTTSQTVTKGGSAGYTVTFSSLSGFAGTVIPAALNWSPQIPGATAFWSPTQVTVPSTGRCRRHSQSRPRQARPQERTATSLCKEPTDR